MRPKRLTIALAAAASAAALSSATAVAAPPKTFFGLVPHEEPSAADYQMMTRANVGIGRVTLSWTGIEPSDDGFDWRTTDRLIGGFASRGIAVLPLLNNNPAWLPGSPTTPPVGSARQRQEWQEFVAAAVDRYGPDGTYWQFAYELQFPGSPPPPRIKTWQLWNEQNGPKHFHPRPSVGKYATLLQITAQAIEQQDPGAEVLAGGMASKPTGKGGIKAWKYVRKLLRRKSARRSVDHFALHPYARNVREIRSHVKKMRRALGKRGKRKAQVWITELGWSSRRRDGGKLGKSTKQQAKLLQRSYGLLKRKRRKWRVGGVYWYTWRDFEGGICDWCPHAGLVKRSGKPKPAYRKYRRVARG